MNRRALSNTAAAAQFLRLLVATLSAMSAKIRANQRNKRNKRNKKEMTHPVASQQELLVNKKCVALQTLGQHLRRAGRRI